MPAGQEPSDTAVARHRRSLRATEERAGLPSFPQTPEFEEHGSPRLLAWSFPAWGPGGHTRRPTSSTWKALGYRNASVSSGSQLRPAGGRVVCL